MSRNISIYRRLRRWLVYTVTTIFVVAAVLVSVTRLLLSNVDAYRSDIEQLASAYLAHAVKMETLEASFHGLTPTLIFKHVYLMDKAGQQKLVGFNEARIGIDLWASWLNRQIIPRDVVIDGIELVAIRGADGKIGIQGLQIKKTATNDKGEKVKSLKDESLDLTGWLFQHARLAIRNSVIVWKDSKSGGQSLRFEEVSLVMQNEGEKHMLTGQVTLPARFGKRLEVAMDVNGNMRLPTTWKGRLYLKARALKLKELGDSFSHGKFAVHTGLSDIGVWLDVDRGRLHRISGDLAVYNLDLEAPFLQQRTQLKLLAGLFDYRMQEQNWSLAVDRFKLIHANHIWPLGRFSVRRNTGRNKQPELDVVAEYFRIEDVSRLLLQTTLLPEKAARWVKKARPSGDVMQFALQTSLHNKNKAEFQLQAHLQQVATEAVDDMPGFHGINGKVWTDAEHGQISLDSQYASLRFPRMFREPHVFNKVGGKLLWQKLPQGWQLWSDEIELGNNDAHTLTRFQLDIPASDVSMFLDLQTVFDTVDISRTSKYLPVGIMDEELVQWVDASIKGGNVAHGGAVFRGRFRDFPFVHPNGQFLVEFGGKNIHLAYQKGWPAITDGEMQAVFDSRGVAIRVASARILNSRITQADISIADYEKPQLAVSGKVVGELRDIARFLVESPIKPDQKELVAQSTIKGQAETRLKIQIPLSAEMKQLAPFAYNGEVRIINGALSMWQGKVDLKQLNGTVVFSEAGEQGRSIRGRCFDNDAVFDVITAFRGKVPVMKIVARSRISAEKALKLAGLRTNRRITGSTSWQGVFTLGYEENGKRVPPAFQLNSDLRGVRLDLPAPLIKTKEESRDFSMRLEFPDKDRMNLKVEYDKRFSTVARFRAEMLQRMNVHFGQGRAVLPEKDVIRISGAAREVTFGSWRQTVNDFVRGRRKGRPLPVEFDMQLLSIKKADESERRHTRQIPARTPLVSGRIENFVYDDIHFGQLDFRTSRIRNGIKLDKLLLVQDEHKLIATGQWQSSLLGDTSQLQIDLRSPDAGELMQRLGYAAVLRGGALKLTGKLAWPQSPDRLSLKKMMGQLHVDLRDGSITNVDAGAGRLLGLFSLTALPRRLALDFKDTFDSGFSYDEITGDLTLKEGSAFTENLVTKSPVAEIIVKGRTGYVVRDFDQHVTVIPKVGSTLPVPTALLFGLEIGAAIALLDTLMGHEIDKANMREYRITGSWDKPVITEITKPREEGGNDVFDDEES